MSADLIERLRASARGLCTENPADYAAIGLSVQDALDAATRISDLERELAETRGISMKASEDAVMWFDRAEAAERQLATMRADALEEAAKIAGAPWGNPTLCGQIAARIRSLAAQPTGAESMGEKP
jgi:hypothetical protein